MSVRLMSAVFESALNPTQRLVALALADFGNDDGESIYPAVATVARKTGLSERSVKAVLATFRASGLIETSGEPRRVRGGRIPVYRMLAERLPRQGAGDAPSAGDAPRPGERPAPSQARQGAGRSPDPSLDPSKNKPSRARGASSKRATTTDEPEGFAEWYAVYPRRIGRFAAAAAYGRAVGRVASFGAPLEETIGAGLEGSPEEAARGVLLAAARRYAANRPSNLHFVPHPATWLNEGRWLDDPEPARDGVDEDALVRSIEEARARRAR